MIKNYLIFGIIIICTINCASTLQFYDGEKRSQDQVALIDVSLFNVGKKSFDYCWARIVFVNQRFSQSYKRHIKITYLLQKRHGEFCIECRQNHWHGTPRNSPQNRIMCSSGKRYLQQAIID
jgi:hypothetical protein